MNRVRLKPAPFGALTAALVAASILLALLPALPAQAATSDLARLGTTTASATQNDGDGGFPASNATDGNASTRWASGNGPDSDTTFTAWLASELQAPATLSGVSIAWEAAFATEYTVSTALEDPENPASWATQYTTTTGDGGTDAVTFGSPVHARYVRVDMLKRTAFTWDPNQPHYYGYSVFSLAVDGEYDTPRSDFGGTSTGTSTPFVTFDAGVPSSFIPWGSSAAATPALTTTVDGTRPGASGGNNVLAATVATAAEWNGFTYEERANNQSTTYDWSEYDGFSFWFLGQGTGRAFAYELHNRAVDGAELGFEARVIDDTVGWRKVSVLFNELTPKSGVSAAAFNPAVSTGFAVTLTGLGVGTFVFDDFSLDRRAVLLDDFESGVTGNPDAKTGYFPWMSSDATVTLGTEALARGDVADNDVLAGSYQIPAGGWGGISNNLSLAQDFSSFRGIRFWWYASQANNPASPSAGADIQLELKDGGPDAEHAENWRAMFKDNWSTDGSRWKLVSLPFASFELSSNQPGSEATRNGVLELTSAWGYAFTFPGGGTAATSYAIDDVQLYGTPRAAGGATITTGQDVYLVDAGNTASVAIGVQTENGAPLEEPLSVAWTTGTGTAQPGTDYTVTSGTLTFPAGTESGSTQTAEISTLAGASTSTALTIPLQLTSTANTPSAAPQIVINAHGLPYLDENLPDSQRVEDLLGRMTLQEKAGQMAQAERLGLSSPQQIGQLGLGSLLSGGGSVPAGNTPQAWADMIDGYQRQALVTRLQIPLVYGVDAVHGHSNVKDATIYPHNIGLGATRDPALVGKISEETAVETKTTGANWAFAPCLCVSRDERWGRTYESFGEDPALVTTFAKATVEGLQGTDPTDITGADEVLASAKHWAGDGGTTYDASAAGTGQYPIDQGVTDVASQQQFEQLYVTPYVPAVKAGVGTIMPSYSAERVAGGEAIRMTENPINQSVLKDTMGFDGFLISDWQAIDKLAGGTYADKVVRSVNIGALDMAMAPYNYGDFITAVVQGVNGGRIAQSRVDDAVRRILTEKFELGLFENPFADDSLRDRFGGAAHRATAAEAAAKSQVLLKNSGSALPLSKTGKLYVAGSNADDLGNQMGGWTISWQGGSGNDMTAGTTILEGIRGAAPELEVTYSKTASADTAGYDAGLVVVGETPYAEGQGDVGNNGRTLELSPSDKAAVDRVCSTIDTCVVVVVSGRPLMLTDISDKADAIVSGFLPGSQGEGVSSVLLGDTPFTGRLPLSWPASTGQLPINVGDASYEPAWAYGWGLRTDSPRDRLTGIVGELDGEPRAAVQALLDADVWAADGSLDDVAAGLRRVAAAASSLSQADRAQLGNPSLAQAQSDPIGTAVLAHADVVVSVARDAAQAAIVAQGSTPDAGAVKATAEAEHLHEAGDAYDAVLELAAVAGVVIDQDTVAPVTAVTLDPAFPSGANGWWTSPVKLMLAATDAQSGVASTQYAFGDEAWRDYTAPVTIDTDGAQNVRYRSVDAAGNLEAAQTVEVKVDRSASTVFSSLGGTDPVSVTLTATDATSGVAAVRYRVGAGAWTDYSGPFQLQKTTSEQVVEFVATDAAGNTSSTQSVTVPAELTATRKSTTKLAVSARNVLLGSPLTATIQVGPANGLGEDVVSFYDGPTLIATAPLVNGKATLTLDTLAVGSHRFQAKFAGNATLKESASPVRTVAVGFRGLQR